jgi:hypothetical protein
MALVKWARLQIAAMPALTTLVYIPNDAKRSRAERGIVLAMGLRKGVWDYFLAHTTARAPGLWIEMKSPDDGLSEEQERWGELMRERGYVTHVSRSWPNAADMLKAYIQGGEAKVCWQ